MRNTLVEPTLRGGSPPRSTAAVGRKVLPRKASDDLSLRAFVDLFQAVGAVRHPTALSVLFGCVIAGVLLGGFLSTLGGHSGIFLSLLGALSVGVATATGINAAGVLLMAEARELPPRELQAAIVHGLMCVPKCIVLGATLLLVAFVVMVGLTAGYFICRVPLIGPLLFVVAFPISVLIGGATFSGLSLCLFLALPAIWDGASLATAIAQALAIARARLVEAFLLMAAVGGLTLMVGGVVFGALLAGLLPMLMLAATIFGIDAVASLPGLLLLFGHGEAAYPVATGTGGDHAIAIAIGSGMLTVLAGSLVMLVPLLGLALVYLRLKEGIAAGRAGPAPADRDTVRPQAPHTATSTADRYLNRVLRAATAAPGESSAEDLTLPLAIRRNRCPHCLSSVASDDVFCGICGYKLG